MAYPTEAVYGLGCDPFNGEAVERLMDLKGRPRGKVFILIAADFQDIASLVAPISESQRLDLEKSWPGPVTWVMPAAAGVPRWLTGGGRTLAVRVTAHPLAAALCRAFGGALVSTSANPAGLPPARTPVKVRDYFGSNAHLLSGSLGQTGKPTPIFDLQTGARLR